MSLLSGLVCLAAACAPGELNDVALPLASVDLRLNENTLTVVGLSDEAEPGDAEAAVTPGTEPLTYVLTDAQGHRLAEGSVLDPRRVRSELAEVLDDADVVSNTAEAVLSLKLPDAAGDLTLYEGDPAEGAVVARMPFSGTRGLTRTQALMSQADVLVPPRFFAGSQDALFRVLFVSEGYREADLAGFRADATRLFTQLLAHPDYAPHARHFAGALAEVRSLEPGVDDPRLNTHRNTAFETRFGQGSTRRCLWFESWDGLMAAINLGRQVNASVVVVVANTTEYAGCAGGGTVVVSRHRDTVKMLGHELGHSLFGLADEYTTGYGYTTDRCLKGTGAVAVNISRSAERSNLSWADLVAEQTPLPTPNTSTYAQAVGAFRGAAGCKLGYYRPQETCLMKHLNSRMCAVCQRAMNRRFSPPPPTSQLSASQ